MTEKKRIRLIGDKAFYQKVFKITIPIMIQNLITSFVSLLDNVMVGQVGTEPMSGVAIVNQLLFVYNLCLFGGMAGPGIFTAQYYGRGDEGGVRHTFRAKLWVGLVAWLVFSLALLFRGGALISLFLHEGGEALDLDKTLHSGLGYLHVMMLQMLPFALQQVYASTLRETGETMLPMRAGIAAVLINLVFNYVLIFGKLGTPALGVVGAAIATVLSRYAECAIVLIWAHSHREKCPYVARLYRPEKIPGALLRQVFVMGTPLLLNELRHERYKKIVQTFSYLPHFISWVTLSGLFIQLLSPSTGPVAALTRALGGTPYYFMGRVETFRWVLVVTNIWKSVGWGSIIYLAALSGVDQEMYEAALIDGATRFQRVWYITLPSIFPTITIMLILQSGSILNDNFDQVYNMMNDAVYRVSNVLGVYTYDLGLKNLSNAGLAKSTAVGLFKNVIALILVLTTNTISKKISDNGIW